MSNDNLAPYIPLTEAQLSALPQVKNLDWIRRTPGPENTNFDYQRFANEMCEALELLLADRAHYKTENTNLLRALETSTAANQALQEKVEALQRFKDYTHRRLDQLGIDPHHEANTTTGCRVGARFDEVVSRMHREPEATPTPGIIHSTAPQP